MTAQTDSPHEAQQKSSRIALISTQDRPFWHSCKSIKTNLRTAYDQLSQQFSEQNYTLQYHSFDERMSESAARLDGSEVLDLAHTIRAGQPDKICFLDNAPHPRILLHALKFVYGSTQTLPALCFHLYGDFTLYPDQWMASQKLLLNAPVTLICASPRQALMVSSFLCDPGFAVDICPFPIDVEVFKFDESARRQQRAALKIHDNETVFIYAGRLSQQKNVLELIDHWGRAVGAGDFRLVPRLLIAGAIDDLGSPLFSEAPPVGQYHQSFNQLLDSLSPKIRAQILYLGDLSAPDLARVYNAADVYLSLSCHHDEDFGMAVGEALCCGLPVVLSSWGGFTGFASAYDDDCQFVPVQLKENSGLRVDWTCFAAFIQRAVAAGTAGAPVSHRAARAQRYQERFSPKALAATLRAILNKSRDRFTGFNAITAALAYARTEGVPFPEGPVCGSLYELIYRAYLD